MAERRLRHGGRSHRTWGGEVVRAGTYNRRCSGTMWKRMPTPNCSVLSHRTVLAPQQLLGLQSPLGHGDQEGVRHGRRVLGAGSCPPGGAPSQENGLQRDSIEELSSTPDGMYVKLRLPSELCRICVWLVRQLAEPCRICVCHRF